VGDRVLIWMKERVRLRRVVSGMVLALAACSRGVGDDQNLGVASGNSLTSAEIDAALGPANQQRTLANEMNGPTNATRSGARAAKGPIRNGRFE